MNKERKARLQDVVSMLEDALDELEDIQSEEQDAFDNLSDSAQSSEKGEAMESYIDAMDNGIAKIESAISCVRSIGK